MTGERPSLSEVGECCATCQFYTWGDQTHIVPHYVHGYCRAYMVVTQPEQVCDSYRVCPACRYT